MKLIRSVVEKFSYAFEGLIYAIKTDTSISIQFAITILVLGFALIIKMDTYDFIVITVMCFLVIVAEFFNSAIEKLADFVCGGKYELLIKRAKDISSAAVLVTSSCAAIVGVIIFIQYF